MSMLGKTAPALFLILFLTHCAKQPSQPPSDFDSQNLLQSWTHSREEEQPDDSSQIFRPSAFKTFAPSRFRMQYVFKANGECEWMYLDPADGHHLKPGTWKIDQKADRVIRIYDVNGQLTAYSPFRIVELGKDILRISPVGF